MRKTLRRRARDLDRAGRAAFAVLAAVIVEIALPGKAVYHAGWYNVALGGLASSPSLRHENVLLRLTAFGAVPASSPSLSARSPPPWPASPAVCSAPTIKTSSARRANAFASKAWARSTFPLPTRALREVTLERPLRGPLAIGTGARNAGNFVLRASPRDVVYVEARDLRGNRLTITQPAGSVFLSPVLLMEHRQTIARHGPSIRFVQRAGSAAHRQSRRFSRRRRRRCFPTTRMIGEPAVLFAVDDENDRATAARHRPELRRQIGAKPAA